jgi:TetR/AcrR family transcriptional regulator, repressor of fatR-cypB operon
MARPKDESKIEVIYEATLSLVLKTGYASLTMAEVAKEAGMATGTLYIYFKNKEELINKLFIHLKEEKMKAVLKVYNPAESFFVSFKKLWLAYFKISLEHPNSVIFIEQYTYSPYLTQAVKARVKELLHPLEQFIASAQQAQLVKEIPPMLLLSHLFGSIIEIVKYHYDNKIMPDKRQIEDCFEMAWSSIRK